LKVSGGGCDFNCGDDLYVHGDEQDSLAEYSLFVFCFFVCLFFIHRFKTHIEFKTVDDTDDYVEPA